MILAVKWVDSTNYSYGWTRYSTTDVSIREITTCGILIDEDDDKIVLSHSKSTVPNDIYYVVLFHWLMYMVYIVSLVDVCRIYCFTS